MGTSCLIALYRAGGRGRMARTEKTRFDRCRLIRDNKAMMSPDDDTFLRREEGRMAAEEALMALTKKKFEALLKSCPPSGPLLILAAAAAAADNRILQNDTAEIPEGKEGRKLI